MSLSAVDWFSGVGGFRLGLERAGARVVASCELAEFPRAVYRERFGEEPTWEDVLDVQPEAIPQADLWCGGFPCQDLSSAGKRLGLLAPGKRSVLVWRLLGLASVARPRWIWLENVRGLLVRGRGFGELLGVLARLGYRVAWRTLDAASFGVPQRRRRVFVLAGRVGAIGACPALVLAESSRVPGAADPGGETWEEAARAAEERAGGGGVARCLTAHPGRLSGGETFVVARTLRACEGKSRASDATASTFVIAFDQAQVTHPENRSRCEPGAPAYTLAANSRPAVAFVVAPKFGQGSDLRARPAERSPALTATDHRNGRGIRMVQASGVRRMTPLEWERCFGFPDGWTAIPGASDSQRYRALGNSVAVPAIEWIARRLVAAEEGRL